MAEQRTSTRAGSRRTTPQPVPQTARVGTQSPPKRITRAMRSQSRDISDSEGGRTGLKTRRGAKQATPDETNGAAGQSGSKSRKRRPADHARIQEGGEIRTTDYTFHARSPGPGCLRKKDMLNSQKPAVRLQKMYLTYALLQN